MWLPNQFCCTLPYPNVQNYSCTPSKTKMKDQRHKQHQNPNDKKWIKLIDRTACLTESKSSWTLKTSSVLTDNEVLRSDWLPLASGKASSSVIAARGKIWKKSIMSTKQYNSVIREIWSEHNLPLQMPGTLSAQEENTVLVSP